MKAELVKSITADDLILNGLLVEGNKDKPVLLMIHGFESDFFSHKFIESISNELSQNDLSFLTVQTRGSFIKQEVFQPDGEVIYGGCEVELLNEAYLDIDAWVKFLADRGFTNIVLSGHSLGTIKSVRYMFEGKYKDNIKSLILFCPFDKNGEMEVIRNETWRENVIEAKKMIDAGRGREMTPAKWHEIHTSYQTYYSWYFEDDFGCMFDFYRKDYDFPILKKINVPVHIIVGTKDEFFHITNPEHPEEAMNILIKNLEHGTGELIEDAMHVFRGYEEIVAEEVLKFMKG
jgi:pimeloyl-ACP methyl ester carboxylesterase